MEIVKSYHRYLVSESGKVYRQTKHKIKELSYDDYSPYLMVTLYVHGKPERWKIHRLVATMFIPNPNNYPVVNHIDGNKRNNRVENLEWCTYKHNNQHAINTGLNNISETNHSRWLDAEWADKTRANMKEGCANRRDYKGYDNPNSRYCFYIDGRKATLQDVTLHYDCSSAQVYRWIYHPQSTKYRKKFKGLTYCIL